MDLFITICFAMAGGILPAMIWLWFWLREDKDHPEPKWLIFKSFIYGMVAVPVALLLQWLVDAILLGGTPVEEIFLVSYPTAITALLVWAFIEELLKYKAAENAALKSKDNDEPIDVLIYLITAALGFSALENTLFIFAPILGGDTTTAFVTGNLRFIGATLLHVASSALIGIFAAFSFYKNRELKSWYLLLGFFFSVLLHTVFNSFIIRAEQYTLVGFAGVWLIVIFVILLFEKIKKIYKPNQTPYKPNIK